MAQGAVMQQQLAHALNQEMAMLTGNSDPLMGVPTTPYWKRMYGELGQAGGPYVPKRGFGK
jgi:hypothetical protein